MCFSVELREMIKNKHIKIIFPNGQSLERGDTSFNLIILSIISAFASLYTVEKHKIKCKDV